MRVLHLHDKRCSLGIHESLVMIVTSFTLRSPCSWKLQCEMYVLQFGLNLFRVVLAQLRVDVALPLHRRIYVYIPSPLYIYIFTRSHPQIYLSTTPHPHICTSISHLYIHTVAPSHLSCLSFFLHIFSLVLPLHLHASTHLYRTCTSTQSLLRVHPFFLSFFLSFYISFPQYWTITCLALRPPVV